MLTRQAIFRDYKYMLTALGNGYVELIIRLRCRVAYVRLHSELPIQQTVQTAGHVTIQLILYGEAQGSLGRGLDDPVDQDVMVNNVGHGLVMCQTALDITNVIIAEEREARHQ